MNAAKNLLTIATPTLLILMILIGNSYSKIPPPTKNVRSVSTTTTTTPPRNDGVRQLQLSSLRNPTSTPTASPESTTTTNMPEVEWSDTNTATMEFCEDGNDSYGYRIPGTSECKAAGIIVRMSPGQSYVMTLINTASVTTNVHTHGLHISGDGNADDPTRYAEAGCSLRYYWDIPSNHMGGTFWMHAHHHGSTEEQVSGGAFAMVIIEEQSSLVSNLDESSKGNVHDWTTKELLLVASRVGGILRDTVLGNGVTDQSFNMFVGEWYRLRIAAVDPSGVRNDLTIDDDDCEAYPVAYDGVWRQSVPGSAASSYSLSGASRIDLAIRCNTVGESTVTFAGSTVATLNVLNGSSSLPNATPFTSTGGNWQPDRPSYLRDLTGEDAEAFETYTITVTAFTINGVRYSDGDPALDEFDYDTLQEWTLDAVDAHPFHLHVYHMQVVRGCAGHEVGEYYDTIMSTDDSEPCVVRFHVIDLGGRVMMHCHVLTHEDNGAMAWVDVVGVEVQSDEDREQFDCPVR